jgi:ferritin
VHIQFQPSPTANRAFRQRVLLAAAKFLEDKNLETRYHAQELVKFLTTEGEDFESVVCNKVASNTRGRITKTRVITLNTQ